MNTTALVDAAQAQGIEAEITNGRVQLGGKEGCAPGRLVRLFASLGLDVLKEPQGNGAGFGDGRRSVSWSVRMNGEHVASIVSAQLGKGPTLTAFAFTTLV